MGFTDWQIQHAQWSPCAATYPALQDLDLKTFSKLVCSLLDIPLYENPVESLHLLFSLYLEFKHNPVFGQQLLSDNGPGAVLNPG
jgi:hypothetical protein